MKMSKLIILLAWLLLLFTRCYAQDFKQYAHILTKAEATTTGVQIGCDCYQNVQWKQASTTSIGLPESSRRLSEVIVRPPQTEVYDLYESKLGNLVLRERHTVFVIDLRTSIKETGIMNVMADRTLTFVGTMVNIGSFVYNDNYVSTSIIKDWVLNIETNVVPPVISRKEQHRIMGEKEVEKKIMTKNDYTNGNLIDVWNYTYSVNLKGKGCIGAYERTIKSTNTQVVNVYKLWITQFRDKASQKDWKVVIDSDIEKAVNATPDCINFAWEMSDYLLDPLYPLWRDNFWHLQTGSRSNYLKIPKTDLQIPTPTASTPISMDKARVKNDDLGYANGTVKVSCVDGVGVMHVVYSRNPSAGYSGMITQQAAKVYFKRDVDLAGNSITATSLHKPLWFIFWQEGQVVSLLQNVLYDNTIAGYGSTSTGRSPITSISSITINHDELKGDIDEKNITGLLTGKKFKFGSTGGHAQGLIGTLIHEKYHYATLTTLGWRDQVASHGDTDRIPDAEESVPGTLPEPNNGLFPHSPNAIFPRSYISNPDTYNSVAILGTTVYTAYGDEEFRCRMLQYHVTSPALDYWKAYYIRQKDWSAVKENLNW
jgi:hypothetical protein